MGRASALDPGNHGQASCGQVLQKTWTPLVALPVTVHVPVQPCRQLHEIGPVPQPFWTHMTGSIAPPARCEQICPAWHVMLPPAALLQTVLPHGARSTIHTPFLHCAAVRPPPPLQSS